MPHLHMPGAKRILYVHHGGGQGGAANSLLFLLEGLDRRRFQPLVSCDFAKPHARQFFSENGLEPIHVSIAPFTHTTKTWKLHTPAGLARFVQWSLIRYPNSKDEFSQLIHRIKPDLVHLNGISLLPLAPLAKRSNIPVVQHIREPVNPGSIGLRKAWLRRLADRNVDHMIYICIDNQQRFTVPSVNSSVIYNPIDVDRFESADRVACREQLHLPKEGTVLLFPGGSLLEIKGIFPFLDALRIVRRSHPDVRAIVPGIDRPPNPRDHTRMRVEARIDEYRLEDCILRLPFSHQVEQYYAASDIVVAPFVVPHFSRAVIEAGAASRPVVASRIGGISEVLRDRENGLLVTAGDAGDLALKLEHLIDDRRSAIAMGATGHLKAVSSFSADLHAQRVMDVYDRILATAH